MLIFFIVFLSVILLGLTLVILGLTHNNERQQIRYDHLWSNHLRVCGLIAEQYDQLAANTDTIDQQKATIEHLRWELDAAHMMLETVIDHYEDKSTSKKELTT